MSRIRGRDTGPEMMVRRFLHACGLRYRLHVRDLPGRPDLVFPRYRTVVQVNGCFWHQHADPACPYANVPQTNQRYWLPKLERTKQRDAETRAELEAMGWHVECVWECDIGPERLAVLARTIRERESSSR